MNLQSERERARLADIEAALWFDHDKQARDKAEREVFALAEDNRTRRVHGFMSDAEVRDLAKRRADFMTGAVVSMPMGTRGQLRDRLAVILRALDARPITNKKLTPAGIIARVCCGIWWAAQLKRAVVQDRERIGRDTGSVCAVKRQPYVTDDTWHRLDRRDKANAKWLESTEIESADGEVITLAQASAASVANPVIRRGELMTRIRGCDEWATRHGWVGYLTTHTTPSRFHAVGHDGKLNPRWIEASKPTPKDGQAWLCKTWARTRAALQRRGLDVFGVRVAEPHHDATPHWHMLVWCKPAQKLDVIEVMAQCWLSDSGREKGANKHRFNAKELWPGGAAGYVAKYIAKGIDDAGAVELEGHHDDLPEGRKITLSQADMVGGGAARVRAWSRAHNIRQFQAIGQPPVTVWRELRRVEVGEMQHATDNVLRMWDSVNRDGEKRASFAEYIERQGGACVGRDYRVAVAKEDRENVGRYEVATKAAPVGVIDRQDVRQHITRSSRKEWKPRGTWDARDRGSINNLFRVSRNESSSMDRGQPWGGHLSGDYGISGGVGSACAGGRLEVGAAVLKQAEGAQPWTRVNNCTGTAKPKPAQEGPSMRERFAWAFADDWREAYDKHRAGFLEDQARKIRAAGDRKQGSKRNEQPVQRLAIGQSDRQGPRTPRPDGNGLGQRAPRRGHGHGQI